MRQRSTCQACGNLIEQDPDGKWVDPNEVGNEPDLCLLNEPKSDQFGPHVPVQRCACGNTLDEDRDGDGTQCVYCAYVPDVPHQWTVAGGQRCAVCNLVGTGDPMNDGNCSGRWEQWDEPGAPSPTERLEYLRGELRAERISMSELLDLQSLAQHIQPGDVELLEPAGVAEECAQHWPCDCETNQQTEGRSS